LKRSPARRVPSPACLSPCLSRDGRRFPRDGFHLTGDGKNLLRVFSLRQVFSLSFSTNKRVMSKIKHTFAKDYTFRI
jgi:hypothetical protein